MKLQTLVKSLRQEATVHSLNQSRISLEFASAFTKLVDRLEFNEKEEAEGEEESHNRIMNDIMGDHGQG